MYVLYVYASAVLAGIAGLVWFTMFRQKAEVEAAAEEAVAAGGNNRGRLERGALRNRMRNRGQGAVLDENESPLPEEFEKLDKKSQLKADKKAAKDEERQYRQEMQDAKKEKEEKRIAADEKRKEERMQKEKEEEEEAEKLRLEKEKKEQEEYDKWKDMLSVADEGSGEAETNAESQGLLQEFIDYIKANKVVVLDNVAAEFDLHAQDVINRVTSLESMGRITGVLDDRGKFIFISPEELEKVAAFVNKKGRISITDLAAESRNLIQLSPEEKPGTEETQADA